jgi:hypothetical protein
MLSLSDTAPSPDMAAIREALASISVSGASCPRAQETPYLRGTEPLLFYYSGFEPRLIVIRLRESSASPAWIDEAFAGLKARLVSAPDQDLLDAAQDLGSPEPADISDEWIEAISDRWSHFRD